VPVAGQRGGQTTRRQSQQAGLRNPGINQRLWGLIVNYSEQLRLDPYAVAAVSKVEGGGRFGAIGDAGTSFGPFQLHVGGALPPGRDAAWANSPQGVWYAMQHMATVAGGLHGLPAVRAIVTRFERPAQPGQEVSAAWGGYRSFGPPADTQNVRVPGFNLGPLIAQQRTQFAQAQQSLLDQLKQQAAMSRQQALAQSAAQQIFQRHQAAQQAQMQLTGQPAAGLTTDASQNLVDQQRAQVQALRQRALQRAGLLAG